MDPKRSKRKHNRKKQEDNVNDQTENSELSYAHDLTESSAHDLSVRSHSSGSRRRLTPLLLTVCFLASVALVLHSGKVNPRQFQLGKGPGSVKSAGAVGVAANSNGRDDDWEVGHRLGADGKRLAPLVSEGGNSQGVEAGGRRDNGARASEHQQPLVLALVPASVGHEGNSDLTILAKKAVPPPAVEGSGKGGIGKGRMDVGGATTLRKDEITIEAFRASLVLYQPPTADETRAANGRLWWDHHVMAGKQAANSHNAQQSARVTIAAGQRGAGRSGVHVVGPSANIKAVDVGRQCWLARATSKSASNSAAHRSSSQRSGVNAMTKVENEDNVFFQSLPLRFNHDICPAEPEVAFGDAVRSICRSNVEGISAERAQRIFLSKPTAMDVLSAQTSLTLSSASIASGINSEWGLLDWHPFYQFAVPDCNGENDAENATPRPFVCGVSPSSEILTAAQREHAAKIAKQTVKRTRAFEKIAPLETESKQPKQGADVSERVIVNSNDGSNERTRLMKGIARSFSPQSVVRPFDSATDNSFTEVREIEALHSAIRTKISHNVRAFLRYFEALFKRAERWARREGREEEEWKKIDIGVPSPLLSTCGGWKTSNEQLVEEEGENLGAAVVLPPPNGHHRRSEDTLRTYPLLSQRLVTPTRVVTHWDRSSGGGGGRGGEAFTNQGDDGAEVAAAASHGQNSSAQQSLVTSIIDDVLNCAVPSPSSGASTQSDISSSAFGRHYHGILSGVVQSATAVNHFLTQRPMGWHSGVPHTQLANHDNDNKRSSRAEVVNTASTMEVLGAVMSDSLRGLESLRRKYPASHFHSPPSSSSLSSSLPRPQRIELLFMGDSLTRYSFCDTFHLLRKSLPDAFALKYSAVKGSDEKSCDAWDLNNIAQITRVVETVLLHDLSIESIIQRLHTSLGAEGGSSDLRSNVTLTSRNESVSSSSAALPTPLSISLTFFATPYLGEDVAANMYYLPTEGIETLLERYFPSPASKDNSNSGVGAEGEIGGGEDAATAPRFAAVPLPSLVYVGRGMWDAVRRTKGAVDARQFMSVDQLMTGIVNKNCPKARGEGKAVEGDDEKQPQQHNPTLLRRSLLYERTIAEALVTLSTLFPTAQLVLQGLHHVIPPKQRRSAAYTVCSAPSSGTYWRRRVYAAGRLFNGFVESVSSLSSRSAFDNAHRQEVSSDAHSHPFPAFYLQRPLRYIDFHPQSRQMSLSHFYKKDGMHMLHTITQMHLGAFIGDVGARLLLLSSSSSSDGTRNGSEKATPEFAHTPRPIGPSELWAMMFIGADPMTSLRELQFAGGAVPSHKEWGEGERDCVEAMAGEGDSHAERGLFPRMLRRPIAVVLLEQEDDNQPPSSPQMSTASSDLQSKFDDAFLDRKLRELASSSSPPNLLLKSILSPSLFHQRNDGCVDTSFLQAIGQNLDVSGGYTIASLIALRNAIPPATLVSRDQIVDVGGESGGRSQAKPRLPIFESLPQSFAQLKASMLDRRRIEEALVFSSSSSAPPASTFNDPRRHHQRGIANEKRSAFRSFFDVLSPFSTRSDDGGQKAPTDGSTFSLVRGEEPFALSSPAQQLQAFFMEELVVGEAFLRNVAAPAARAYSAANSLDALLSSARRGAAAPSDAASGGGGGQQRAGCERKPIYLMMRLGNSGVPTHFSFTLDLSNATMFDNSDVGGASRDKRMSRQAVVGFVRLCYGGDPRSETSSAAAATPSATAPSEPFLDVFIHKESVLRWSNATETINEGVREKQRSFLASSSSIVLGSAHLFALQLGRRLASAVANFNIYTKADVLTRAHADATEMFGVDVGNV